MRRKFRNRKGVSGIEYVILISTMALGLFLGFRYLPVGQLAPSCNPESDFSVICEKMSEWSGWGGSGGSGDLVVGGASIGDPEFDPDPETWYKGAWLFGMGQAYSWDEDKVIYPGENNDNPNFSDLYVSRASSTTMTRVYNSSGSKLNAPNRWIDETRMIEIDPRADCDRVIDGQTWDYCRTTLPWSSLTATTDGGVTDYGELWINGGSEHVALGDGRSAGTFLKVTAGSDLAVYSQSAGGFDLELDARGHQISISYADGANLALGNGVFEVNNSLWSEYASGISQDKYVYKPSAGGAVGAYPGQAMWSPSPKAFWSYYPDQHRVDLRGDTEGWELTGCARAEVPFVRGMESESGYENRRRYDDLEGTLRTGPTLSLKNAAGETWSLTLVDMESIPEDDCVVTNPTFFVQDGA